MAGIKKSLNVLCNHLNFLYNIDITAEDFRLAKFDRNDVVEKFWTLLNVLTINDTSYDQEKIKNYFKSIKYPNNDFNSSKNLLIAASCTLQTALKNAIIKEIEETPFNSKINILQHENVETTLDYSTFECEDDFEKYTEWLRGKIIQNLRHISELKMLNKKILQKMEKSSDDLNINEILAFNSKKYRNIFMKNTERLAKILTNHEEWLKNESTFWTWMISVVEASKETRNSVKKEKSNKQLNVYCSNKYIAQRK